MFPDVFQRTRRALSLVQPLSPLDLPGTGLTLPFNMETQEQSEWCWSAVAVSVSRFYPPPSTITQCELANLELGGGTDVCCVNPLSCNQQNTLETSLIKVGHFNDIVFGPLTFQETGDQINSQRPLGCRIGWFQGGGHFVIIHGSSTESSVSFVKRWVAVADPLFGPADYLIDDFTNAYRQEGEWTHSYLTQ
ncbi:MAG TPA: papain-like cysteine protease family protein [Pyrinomonadaceae bacterium]|nr:papain-like cysteine protease family protein [Pyrinomonadaceae bacterium]